MVCNELEEVAESSSKPLEQGIPQGSTLGPILINLFMSPLGGICQAQRIKFAGYADAAQNYMSFRPLTNSLQCQINCINKLESCLTDGKSWMQVNFLKLNESKTEFIIFGTRQQLNKERTINIRIGEDLIQNVASVRNLGLHFDEELKHSLHVNKLTSIPFNIIHNMSRIRHLLDIETTKTLVQALVLSCLDYCNSMLLGIPNYNIHKLQCIQNMSARIVLQLPRRSRITCHLADLHWLKVPYRIEYKIATLMFKCIHDSTPKYLTELIIVDQLHDHSLRSRESGRIHTTVSGTNIVHESSFHSMGPRIWNNLPEAIITTTNLSAFKT